MSDHHQVRIVGDCSLSNISDNLNSLVKGFDCGGPVTVDLSQVGAVDISFIQLVISASRTAAHHRRPFCLTGMPDAVEASFRRAGIDVGPMCRPNP